MHQNAGWARVPAEIGAEMRRFGRLRTVRRPGEGTELPKKFCCRIGTPHV